MNDVLAVVSLVIGICGSAFMAIAAIRDHCGDTIARIREQADRDADNISTARNPATVIHGERKKRQLGRRLWWWGFIAFVPVAAFGFTVYFISIHVLASCWSCVPCAPEFWPFYRVWIIVLLSVNALAVAAIALTLQAIKATAEDLRAHAEAKMGESAVGRTLWQRLAGSRGGSTSSTSSTSMSQQGGSQTPQSPFTPPQPEQK